jgi:hypothetical protein
VYDYYQKIYEAHERIRKRRREAQAERGEPHDLRRLSVAICCVALLAGLHVESVAAVSRPRFASHVYWDPAADSTGAPDITSVVVAIDDAGGLTLNVSILNRSVLLPSDLLLVGLDVDRDKSTGGPIGIDYAFSVTTTGVELGVWFCASFTGCGYVATPVTAGLSLEPHSVSLHASINQLGALADSSPPRFRLVLIALANTDQPDENWADDVAGPWIYEAGPHRHGLGNSDGLRGGEVETSLPRPRGARPPLSGRLPDRGARVTVQAARRQQTPILPVGVGGKSRAPSSHR